MSRCSSRLPIALVLVLLISFTFAAHYWCNKTAGKSLNDVIVIDLTVAWDDSERRINVGVYDKNERHANVKVKLLREVADGNVTELAENVLSFVNDKAKVGVHKPVGLYVKIGSSSDQSSAVSGGSEMFQVIESGRYKMTFEVSEAGRDQIWQNVKELRFHCDNPDDLNSIVIFTL